jgi:aldose sugar dehydrogenase
MVIIALLAFGLAEKFPAPDSGIQQTRKGNIETAEAVSSYTSFAFASYYDLEIENYQPFPEPRVALGGGLESIKPSQLLLVDGAGQTFFINRTGDQLFSTPLDSPTQLLAPEFLQLHPEQAPQWYRVLDTLLMESAEHALTLYVSYTHWDPDDDCISIGVAETKVDIPRRKISPWITRYRTRPCLPWKYLDNKSGGRLALYDAGHLLLTVGVLGIENSALLSNSAGSYGKVLLINTSHWKSEVYSTGHRNPQGLLVEQSGIWETEHGPFGGDELNSLEAGKDYGWPGYSYGTNYGQKTRGDDLTVGDHSGAQQPFYSWTPSIGVSNLLRVTGDAFPAWRNDLLVGSLYGTKRGNSLHRLRILNGRVLVSEQIDTGHPIRDLVEMPSGDLALWDGRYLLQIVSPGNHIMADCAKCHTLRWHEHGIGPHLMDVLDSKIGRHKDFQYSPAMAAYEGNWTPELLNRFLADPAGTIPGTAMHFPGIKDHKKRWQVISYLQNSIYP